MSISTLFPIATQKAMKMLCLIIFYFRSKRNQDTACYREVQFQWLPSVTQMRSSESFSCSKLTIAVKMIASWLQHFVWVTIRNMHINSPMTKIRQKWKKVLHMLVSYTKQPYTPPSFLVSCFAVSVTLWHSLIVSLHTPNTSVSYSYLPKVRSLYLLWRIQELWNSWARFLMPSPAHSRKKFHKKAVAQQSKQWNST